MPAPVYHNECEDVSRKNPSSNISNPQVAVKNM